MTNFCLNKFLLIPYLLKLQEFIWISFQHVHCLSFTLPCEQSEEKSFWRLVHDAIVRNRNSAVRHSLRITFPFRPRRHSVLYVHVE